MTPERTDSDLLDFHSIEGALSPFLDSLWAQLSTDLPLPPQLKEIPQDELLPPRYEVKVVRGESSTAAAQKHANGHATPHVNGNANGLKRRQPLARLRRNDRMTAKDHFQDVRLLEFEHVRPEDGVNEDDVMEYDSGDVFCVKPQNSDAQVERFLARMGWSNMKDELVEVKSHSPSKYIRPCPLKTCSDQILDIRPEATSRPPAPSHPLRAHQVPPRHRQRPTRLLLPHHPPLLSTRYLGTRKAGRVLHPGRGRRRDVRLRDACPTDNRGVLGGVSVCAL